MVGAGVMDWHLSYIIATVKAKFLSKFSKISTTKYNPIKYSTRLQDKKKIVNAKVINSDFIFVSKLLAMKNGFDIASDLNRHFISAKQRYEYSRHGVVNQMPH